MTASERLNLIAALPATDWAGLAAAGWLVALLTSLLVLRQHARIGSLSCGAAESAHELRGPLCAARLALASLERKITGPSEARSGIAAIDLELRRAAIVADDLATLTGPPVTRDAESSVDVVALVRTAAPAWQALAVARGTRLHVRSESRACRVSADSGRLAQILGNLVANACEHGTGTVSVSVSEGSGRVRLSIADEGPGPSERLIARARGHRTGRLRPGRPGTRGHGLAIVARLVREARGDLKLEATPVGAAIVVDLPARPVSAPAEVAETATRRLVRLRGMRTGSLASPRRLTAP